MPPLTTATPGHQGAQHDQRVHVDIESPRRDAVADYLLDGSLNTAVDRDFADRLLAEHPQLPRVARSVATWDRSAAETMLDRGLRHVLLLGTGGLPLWAHSSTLTDLHDAGARIVVIEHDPITRGLHDCIDRGAAAGRGHVLCLPADHHRDLAATPAVADLLASGAPLGILATGLLRPAGIRLAAILTLLEGAPSGSLAAITQLTAHGADDLDDADASDPAASPLAARFATAGIPIAIEDRLAADQLLADVADVTTHPLTPATLDQDAPGTVVRTVLVGCRPLRTASTALRPGGEQPRDIHGRGNRR
ncbi:SAM-dependent methyltransferase [Amycolatopsis nalaikhensis]|uniref:SAM-dependent methyltransferase n=1 Tax=Amycolatopsis nalaikhensis TaxID=715472 RepID=A0ABY8XYE9_9PSEU|nr:SAM-dependent methyltransferase [Amycolatopsis sp. 2-2]WIV60681.1 SAM-dependent methyltransferase [Amycolatopsis sp. 2-2]